MKRYHVLLLALGVCGLMGAATMAFSGLKAYELHLTQMERV